MAVSTEVRLGQLLIQKRWCTLRQVNRGLAAQRALRDRGSVRSLWSILIEQDALNKERVCVALSLLGSLKLYCERCAIEVPIRKYSPGETYDCPRCQGTLALNEATFTGKKANEAGSMLSPNVSPEVPGSPQDSPSPRASEDEDEADDMIIGKIIGGCQVLSRIAKGGMGVVYKARQLKLGRPVAVKILSEDLAKDRNYVHRFLQEARSAAELNHGNIVHIIDVGEINGLFYIIMEYVDGSNLREILESYHKLDPERAFEVALQASHALKHAHLRGVIHRDIKPENIMIARDGMVKIADLGLAKKIAAGEQDGGITSAGAILGTPYYMAPEQVKDFSKVDGRSDIYSLGVTLFKALSGSVPFTGRTPVEVMINVVEGRRPSLRSLNPEIPEDVELLVDRMMHRRPENRYQSFGEVITEMETVVYRLRSEKAKAQKEVSSGDRRTEAVPNT